MKIKLLTCVLVLLQLWSCDVSTGNESAIYDAGVSSELARLRKEKIRDLEYNLFLSLPERKDSAVCGNMDIDFCIDAPCEIVFDFREGENVKSVSVNGNPVAYTIYNEHIIIPASSFKKGANRARISFVAENQSLNRNDDYLYTLLVPDRARTVFPCFDQPDMKATFKLTLEIPEAWTAISNSSVSKEEIKNGRRNISFEPTEPLSTYLFSFVAGVFKKEIYDDGKHVFSAYHRESDPVRISQMPTIFAQVAMSLAWMEEYTGIPYPFAKYDLIILPGFQYGGMEHTGATLYNDTKMFLSAHPTPDEELERAQLIAHETAHMWFGDFVTMRWFDDVWTKEVFANYFASRITEPMFSDVNYRLDWLKSIVTPALGEDRTLGGTAIRQPLGNMRYAGLVYNSIIYNKAPVMLDKLVEIMGEDAFREGIHDYLVACSYGNASWDDLVKVLDEKSEKDLASFSDVWVNSKGMPMLDFYVNDDTLFVRQSDPCDRGLLWPQSFKVRVVGEKKFDVAVVMDGAETKIPLNDTPLYILPNSDGRGYGYFRFNVASLTWTLDNWYKIDDETCRQSQLMNLHEAYQHGVLYADVWLRSLIKGLSVESNPLVASTVCSYIGRPLTDLNEPVIERELLALANEHAIESCRQQLLRTLITTATDSAVCGELYKMWSDASNPLLNENDYTNLAYELSIRNPEKQKDIIAVQRSRIKNPDRVRQFDFVSRATTPDTLEQEMLFRLLLKAENRRVEPWAIKTLGYLCHPLREMQAVKYIREALDSLHYIQRTSDIFFPQNWTRALLRERYSNEALDVVEGFFADNDNYLELLKNKILQAAWNLQRRVGGI